MSIRSGHIWVPAWKQDAGGGDGFMLEHLAAATREEATANALWACTPWDGTPERRKWALSHWHRRGGIVLHCHVLPFVADSEEP